MVADIGEWVTEGTVLSYADDTTCYVCGEDREEAREKLELASRQILEFMQASKLSANPSKSGFMCFGRKKEEPLNVGQEKIEESQEETLLGITFNKQQTWTGQMNRLRPELLRRTAILRRLKMRLPKSTVCKMLEPIFTAKLRYGIELLAALPGANNTAIKELHSLHRGAMKAVLGLNTKDHPSDEELWKRTGQMSIHHLSLVALATLAWKCGKDWDNALTKGRLEPHHSGRNTRQATMRLFPPQSTVGSLPHKLVEMWEKMPKAIRSLDNQVKAKCSIKVWISENF